MNEVLPPKTKKDPYVFIEEIDEFQTKFGFLRISSMRNSENQKLYIQKEFQINHRSQLKPLEDFLTEFDAFQAVSEIKEYLLSVEDKKVLMDSKSSSYKLVIIQKNRRSFSLSRLRKRKVKELDVIVILRDIAKFYSLLIKSQIKGSILNSDFLKTLSSKNIFYFPSNQKNKPNKLNRYRLKIDFLSFIQEENPPLKALSQTVGANRNPKTETQNLEVALQNSHANSFCALIIELFYQSSLTPSIKTEENGVSIKDLNANKKMGVSLMNLFVKGWSKLENQTTHNELSQWLYLLSNPILNQNLERKNDLNEWGIKSKSILKKKFENMVVFKFKRKKEEGSDDDNEKKRRKIETEMKAEKNYLTNEGNDEDLIQEEEKTNFAQFHTIVTKVNATKNLNAATEEKSLFWKNLDEVKKTIEKINYPRNHDEMEVLKSKHQVYLKVLEKGMNLYKNENFGQPKNDIDFRNYTKLRREYLCEKEKIKLNWGS